MTEDIFKELGFTCLHVSGEETGYEEDWYYYELEIGDICFISNANDEAAEQGWQCSIFDSITLMIKGAGDLEDLVRIIRNNTNETTHNSTK